VRAKLRQYPRGLPTAFYAVDIGDSTRSRKSTIARLGIEIVNDAVPEAKLAEQSSPEAFIEQIATGRDTALWYVDEFSETLDKLRNAKHMTGLRGLLLELYEGNTYSYKRTSKLAGKGERRRDEMIVDKAHLVLLASTTPDAIFETVTAKDVASGFLARFAICMPTGLPDRRPMEEDTPNLAEQRSVLVQWLMKVYQRCTLVPPTVRFADNALSIIDALAIEIEQTVSSSTTAKPMLERLNAMTIKLSMLTAVGRPGAIGLDTLTVEPTDAEIAVRIAQRWRSDALTFAARVGENMLEQTIGKVTKALESLGGTAGRTQIAAKLRINAKLLDEIEATMVDRGDLTVVEGVKANGATGRAPRRYTLMKSSS